MAENSPPVRFPIFDVASNFSREERYGREGRSGSHLDYQLLRPRTLLLHDQAGHWKMTIPPAVYVIDDDDSFRAAMGELLEACGYRAFLCESARQLFDHPLQNEPGCILLDVQMPELTGPQLQQDLIDRGCNLPIVFISGHGNIPITVQTIKAGAEDFLTKPVAQARLLEAVERALARFEAVRAVQREKSMLVAHLGELTPRERQVFDHLVRGLPHKKIAHLLSISERTVKSHRHEIVRKLKVHSLAQLAAIAERLGLLTSD